MRYVYPTYALDLTADLMQQCLDTAVRLLDEVGFEVAHEPFLDTVRGKPGLRIDGHRVYFAPELSREYLDRFAARQTPPPPPAIPSEWTVRTAGYSMCVLDLHTEEPRQATCDDLRDMIKLAGSLGVGGHYPCMPQDVPPLMRAIACFRMCWELSDDIQPYDYQQPEQIPYIYEMHQVMGRRFDITLTVPSAMTVDPKDIDIFMKWHPTWKRNQDIDFRILDYGMLGIMKPVTAVGCATMTLTETLALHILLNLFDSQVQVPIIMFAGIPTDLRNACWAFGSPRRHVFSYLDARIGPYLSSIQPGVYRPETVMLETSSSAPDEQAALEKMAGALLGALQGARTFGYAGTLCVDDLYSGVQLIIDIEMVDYIREMVQAFDPHPDVIDTTGLFEECREVGLGLDTFISHPNTVRRLRNILPSSPRIVREKLNSWIEHRTTLKDRARDEALERIDTFEPRILPGEKRRALSNIYARAEADLTR